MVGMTTFTKTQAITEIVNAARDNPLIFTTGYASRIGASVADRPRHFYMTGSMGLALSVGTGVADVTGRTTVVVDGDGSLLMNPVGLMSAGARSALPLIHVVLDDGQYASTGGQRTPGASVDLSGWARSSGFRFTRKVSNLADFQSVLRSCLETCTSPKFIHCALTGPDASPPARIAQRLPDHARRFTQAIAV
jgi:sulfopyruvate decarboxylase subunit beta